MYESHWKLTNKPFEDRLTSGFYYPSSTHQTALLKMLYAIENRRELVVLCGPSGVGKSLVQQQLRQQLPAFVGPVISLPYPDLERDQLLAYLALQLGSDPISHNMGPAFSLRQIENTLKQASLEEKQILLLIEEAEWMEARGGFETLRLLLNLAKDNMGSNSGLTVLMNGQPSLLPQLERHISLNQRVAARCILSAFSEEETHAYVTHRIRSAGGSADKIFDPESMDSIHSLTDGIPRRINTLCDMLLMVGYAQEMNRIFPMVVEEVHRDLTPIYSS